MPMGKPTHGGRMYVPTGGTRVNEDVKTRVVRYGDVEFEVVFPVEGHTQGVHGGALLAPYPTKRDDRLTR